MIVLTGFSDVRTAVQAIQLGAYQFLTKPVNTDELQVIVQRALERRELLQQIESLRRKVGGDERAGLAAGRQRRHADAWCAGSARWRPRTSPC